MAREGPSVAARVRSLQEMRGRGARPARVDGVGRRGAERFRTRSIKPRMGGIEFSRALTKCKSICESPSDRYISLLLKSRWRLFSPALDPYEIAMGIGEEPLAALQLATSDNSVHVTCAGRRVR